MIWTCREPVDDWGCWMVEDLEVSKVALTAQEAQSEEATQKSEEPVSRTTLKVCGGVPTVTAPM